MQFAGMSNELFVAELIDKHGHVFRRGGRDAEKLFFQLGLVYCHPNAAPECRDYYTREATKLMPPETAKRVLEKEAERCEAPTANKVVSGMRRRDQMDERQTGWRMFRTWSSEHRTEQIFLARYAVAARFRSCWQKIAQVVRTS
jgi:hypothetical protein